MLQKIHQFDRWSAPHIASLPRWLEPFFRLCTVIGHPGFVWIFLIAIAYQAKYYGKPELSLYALVATISLFAPSLLKAMTLRKRPDTLYAAHMKIKSSSFPSGHSYASSLVYGMIGILALIYLSFPIGLIVFLFMTIIVLMVGSARVYLGAHYPSDVVAGWIMAGMVLIGLLWVHLN